MVITIITMFIVAILLMGTGLWLDVQPLKKVHQKTHRQAARVRLIACSLQYTGVLIVILTVFFVVWLG